MRLFKQELTFCESKVKLNKGDDILKINNL